MGKILSLILIVLFVIWACNIEPQKPAKLPDCAIRCSSITYGQIYYTFMDQSHKTSVQKYSAKELEDIWIKDYKARCVYWNGKVYDVSKSTDGQVILYINMGHAIAYDIQLNIDKDSASRALALNKGEKISFCGTMDREPGYWIGMTLANVIIP